MSPARRQTGVKHVVETLGVLERFACRVIVQHRTTQRLVPKTTDNEAALTADIIELAWQYGRYGYRRCCSKRVGLSTRSAWLAFGAEKGSKFRNGSLSGHVFG